MIVGRVVRTAAMASSVMFPSQSEAGTLDTGHAGVESVGGKGKLNQAADGRRPRRLWVRLRFDPLVDERQKIGLDANLHWRPFACRGGAAAFLFLWLQSFLRVHKKSGTTLTSRREGSSSPTGSNR